MAVRIKFDNTHNVIQPTFVLSTRTGEKLGYIPAVDISVSDNFNSAFEMEFKVYEYNNGVKYDLWDKLTDFKLVWCREWNVWFEMSVTLRDTDANVKNISCVSVGEAELSQIMLYDIEVNTEDDILRDDYEPTVLYNPEKKSASLLNRIMSKAPHYSIKYVDSRIKDIQRTFSFNTTSIYDAFNQIAEEIDCIFVIDSGCTADGKPARTVSVYDLESYCVNCGHRESFIGKCPECGSENVLPGYGEDTTIFVSTENLADEITMRTDTSSVKNCFRLEAGDELMTAAIKACNPNGSQYIWYISDEVRADMPEELVNKLGEYDDVYNYYVEEHALELDEEVLAKYNELIAKYRQYNSDLHALPSGIVGYANLMNAYYDTIDLYLLLHDTLMPAPELSRTTAALQAAKLGTNSLSPVAVQDISKASSSTVSSAVLAVAKTIVDPRYQVKVKNGVLTGTTWVGNFTVTSYADDEDTADSIMTNVAITGDYETFVKQKVQKALANKQTDEVTDVVSLFKQPLSLFEPELRKYCLTYLQMLENCGEACLNILIEQGIADAETWAGENSDLYNTIYLPYYEKVMAIQSEIKLREREIELIKGKFDSYGDIAQHGIQTIIEQERARIQDALNFEAFLGTDLWLDFVSYRREDVYSNSNYVSDGLDNAELFDMAKQFIEVAQKEIFKSANLQHSITASLKNLLVMKEFAPIIDKFAVGNWIRVRADDVVYRLRLLSYQISFNDLDDIDIEFSDVTRCMNGFSDSSDILGRAASMATTYDAVTRQAKKGNKGNEKLSHWVDDGLALTKMKIIDNADNQNITWDEHGLLCKEYIPTIDDYSEKQLKIINRGLYLTDDNWRTSKAGIGDFNFYNPITGEYEEAYGVIADTLVGNLILGHKVGVYNVGNSVVMDENGLTITADSSENTTVLNVYRKEIDAEGNESTLPVMYLDADGNLVLTGSMRINAGFDTSIETLNDLCDPDKFTGAIQTIVNQESQAIYSSIDEKYKTIIDDTTAQLEQYKADIGQYMTFNDDGLTLGATTSDFKTVIDNRSMRFKQGDETVAYINNNQLYIENATIKQTLMLGRFFFNPREDGGVSLTWQGGD